MHVSLKPLPYEGVENAFGEVLTDKQVQAHYRGHHAKYVDKLNEKLHGPTPWADDDLPTVLARTRNVDQDVYNLAAQIVNHNLFWESIRPQGDIVTSTYVVNIRQHFGSLFSWRDLALAANEAAMRMMGSGWVWLVHKAGVLKIETTRDADTLIGTDWTPLWCMDVWEHAWYLDYESDKQSYVTRFLNNINWRTAWHLLEAQTVRNSLGTWDPYESHRILYGENRVTTAEQVLSFEGPLRASNLLTK